MGLRKPSKAILVKGACSGLIAFVLLVSLPEAKSSGKEPCTMPGQNQILNNFFRLYEEGSITRLELYYIHWDSLTRFTITEDYIRNTHCDFKVIAMQPHLESMIETMQGMRLQGLPEDSGKPPDIRLGCVIYAGEKEVLSLFWGRNWPFFIMNGSLYETDRELLKAVIPFLPHRAYEKVAEDFKQ
jgi:hypothetical protein